ncbi:MAG: DUF3106 domain-containing protein [Burkholderiaceae bacterium]|nr:DUF3106 domain-containing protein [Burkholderiaceae bacterium]
MLAVAFVAVGGAGAAWAQVSWNSLTPKQQTALSPLADEWRQLNPEQQNNWLAVGRHYAHMAPDEQQILQAHMIEWAALTPWQRNQARFDFNTIKSSLSAKERRAKWEEYRALPEAERRRLAKNRRTLRGAAPALGPPLPGQLVKPPVQATVLQIAPAIPPPIGVYNAPRYTPRVTIPADHNTLLPRALLDRNRGRRHGRP